MAWGKAGSTSLGSEGDDLDITSMTSSKFNQFMIHKLATGSGHVDVTFNNDDTSSYAGRGNAGSETTYTSDTFFRIDGNGGVDGFGIIGAVGISGEEQLAISHWIDANTAGAGNAPTRFESVFKLDTTGTITRIDIHNPSSGGYLTDSNVSALGSDITPAAAVPGVDNVQDNSIFVETDTARRYWFDFTSDVTHSSLTNISASGNLLYSARRYGCKLTSGNTAIGQSVTSLAFNIQDNSYPSGESFYYKVYRSDDGSGDANTSWTQVATTGAISESELPASYAWLEKSFTTPVTLALNDVVCIEAANVGSSSTAIQLSYNSSTSDISTANVKGAFRNSGVSDQFSTTTSGTEATVFKIIGTSATWTMQPTWRDDLSTDAGWVTTDSAKYNYNATNDNVDFNAASDQTDNRITLTLPFTLSDTKWVFRSKVNVTSFTQGGAAQHLDWAYGFTKDDVAADTNTSFIGLAHLSNVSVNAYRGIQDSSSNFDKTGGDDFTHTPAVETIYVEMKRTGSLSYTIELFSDSAFTTSIEKVTGVLESGITDLKYLVMTSDYAGQISGSDVWIGTIDDLKIYNGVTSIT